MKKILIFILFFALVFTLTACEDEPYDDGRPSIPSGPIPGSDDPVYCEAKGFTYDYSNLEYELVWSDEFDGDTLDLTKWKYEINGDGGGNQELQYYTDENATVSNGILSITAIKEDHLGKEYTSSRITTQNKQDWTYGIFEIRAKIPYGRGTWPAIWMMPTYARYGTWPNSGELDIMEHVGYDINKIHGTIHSDRFSTVTSNQKGGTYYGADDVTSEFHVYKVEWLPDRIKFFVDGSNYYTYIPTSYTSCPSNEEWPFDADFFLILNVAIGGAWGGVQGVDDDIFPTTMEIDYVRVYQSDEITNIVHETSEDSE